MTTLMLTKPEVCERKNAPGSWGVEQFDADGACLLTVFSGPQADERAREYAITRAALSPTPSQETKT